MSDTLNDEPLVDGQSEMAVMDTTGDTKTVWDPTNADEVDAVRGMFDTLMGKGFSAFKVTAQGEAGERITEFEPSAGRIIMVPNLVGG